MNDGYEPLDAQIESWARKHSLRIFTYWDGGECRNAYLSSVAGDCYQIWIDIPVENRVGIHIAFVNGPKDEELQRDWFVSLDQFMETLEDAFQYVIKLMAPSTHHLIKE